MIGQRRAFHFRTFESQLHLDYSSSSHHQQHNQSSAAKMDSSRALTICLQELRLSSSAPKTALSRVARHARNVRSRTTTTSPSSRAFSTSTQRPADGELPKAFNPSSSMPNTIGQSSQSKVQGGREPRRIDLSPIMKHDPSYEPPPKREPSPQLSSDATRKQTLSALDQLIIDARAKRAAAGQHSPTTKLMYNTDIYSRSSRTPAATSGSPFDVKDLVGKLRNSPPSGRSADTTAVSQLTSDYSGASSTRAFEDSLRLTPTLGKSISINPTFDLTRAFLALETKVNKNGNRVKLDERNQKFHVRKGQAKKIKRRERWRELFKQGYLAEVGRVRRMIRQGW